MNGLHIPYGFWKVTIGNIFTIGITAITVIYGAGSVNRKIDELTDWRKTVDLRIEHMDEVGTKASAARNMLVDQKNMEQDRRITAMETTLQQVVPDVREIKTKLDLVAKYLEESRDAKKAIR